MFDTIPLCIGETIVTFPEIGIIETKLVLKKFFFDIALLLIFFSYNFNEPVASITQEIDENYLL